MPKTCAQCRQSFEITDEDLAFYDKISPVIGGQKQAIPPPTLCPDCRQQRRMGWRNDRTLHHRKSDLSGRQIVSMYSADKPYKVYDQDEWWSDQWDALTYGRDIDFSKAFAFQFDELSKAVPHISLYTTNNENSYYTNHTLNLKNCYLIGGGGNDEDCMYGRFIVNSKDCVEGSSLYSCERCYEGSASERCYGCLFFLNCRNCSDCLMIEDCQSCHDCIGCFGLRNKQYCILNEQLAKEEFERRKRELYPLSWEKIALLRTKLNLLARTLPHGPSHIFASEDCTGDMIVNSKNCVSCFDVSDCEDCKYVHFTPKGRGSQDCVFTAPDGVEWCYEVMSTVGMTSCMATFLAWYGDRVYYSTECHHCSHLFGCVGLRNKQYCIFNKQYAPTEYEKLASHLIAHMRKTGEWGEYFPLGISRFGYNESVAQEFFPVSREDAGNKGWKWHEEEEQQQRYMGPTVEIPSDIAQVPDAICRQILRCEATGKPYKLTPQELKFYRAMHIPVPRKCPDQRYKERADLRNPRKLWNRDCAKCGRRIATTYSPDRLERVLCEQCYLQAAY